MIPNYFLIAEASLYLEVLCKANLLTLCFGNRIYWPFAKVNCSRYSCGDMVVVKLSKARKGLDSNTKTLREL